MRLSSLEGWSGASGAVRPEMEGLAIVRGRDFPGPTLGKMQSKAAGRAGEPSRHREEPPPEGLGGYHLLAQTDARCPASEVVGHHLDCQPGGVGGETARLAGSAFPGHPRESPRGRIHIMTIGRTNESINKAEDAGRIDAQIRSTDALRRVLPTGLTGYL